MALVGVLGLVDSVVAGPLAVMEGVAASRYTIKVDTRNARVEMSTTSYNGGIANVGLYVSSNVVISTSPQNSVVIYATGALKVGLLDITTTYIRWTDGTTSTTGASGAGGASFTTYVSSVTTPFTGSTAATALSICYATQTVTTHGDKVAVWYSGAVHNSNAGSGCIVGFLQDGAYVSPFTNAIGNGAGISHSANAPATASYHVEVPAPAAGSHSYCLTLAALANTCNISAFSYLYPEFGVREMH